jgi:hypothetical protein
MFWKQEVRRIIKNLPCRVSGNDFITYCTRCMKTTPKYKGLFENGTGKNAQSSNKFE